ncbi:MAG: hypothetical protein IKY53_07925 [Lachnospiraceae bacterium]|nr:hypothetical protein [Lachnospiraceae bacterium]
MLKIEHMECPRCGASLSPEKGNAEVICQFCGAAFQIKDEVNLEEIRATAESKSYGYHKGKLRAEIEADAIKKQNSVNVFMPLIIIGTALLLFAGTWMVIWLCMPKVDPFACISVTFEGIDGDGTVSVRGTDPSVDINLIDYEISKDSYLSEGDSISIVARSGEYRLAERTKTYTVEGLTRYLNDLDNISGEALALIHTRAQEDQKSNLENVISTDSLISMEPIMLFLSTDGKKKNLLYDVFEARIDTPDGEIICYPVTVYNDVIIDKEKSASVKISYGMYCGNYINVGNSIYISAYESIETVRTTIATEKDVEMELMELDLRANQ